MIRRPILRLVFAIALATISLAAGEKPFLRTELIFAPEHWHNHGSCIVEAPNGDLIVCWFHGSGERKADDVIIEGARRRRGSKAWSERFTMADTPGYPDTNCAMFIDPQGRLWLLWPTILANEWHTALMKYRISSDYLGQGPPRWQTSEVLHVTPGAEFEEAVKRYAREVAVSLPDSQWPDRTRAQIEGFLADLPRQAADKLTRRLGWMTRAHPFVLDKQRLIVPLYSDGFDFSLMAITDDWGRTWHTSTPLCGAGNVQPSIVRRRDGSLYTLMRDNGPRPARLLQSESRDRGETWSPVMDTELPNPGSGAEVISLRNGNWALIGNDTEDGRHSLAVFLSDDEGRSWKWRRHLENDPAGAFHYPSLIQSRDGSLHASYTYSPNRRGPSAGSNDQASGNTIKHAHFNEAWVKEGDPDSQPGRKTSNRP